MIDLPFAIVAGVLASAAMNIPYSPASADMTKRVYVHGKLSRQNRMKEGPVAHMKNTINKYKFTKRAADGWLATDKTPWYTPADTARFDGVVKMWVAEFKSDRTPRSHCTAFYVGDDILVTAVHCFASSGITSLADKEGTHLAFIYENFRGEDVTEDDVVKFGRYVTEWWYPADFSAPQCKSSAESAHDWAFFRIEKRKSKPGRYYKLVSNIPFVHEKVISVGYPADAGEVYKRTQVQGTLYQPTETEVKNDKGIVREKKTPAQLAEMQQTMLAMIALPAPGLTYGGFGAGGDSGGPMFLADESLAKASNKGKDMEVVGMNLWGPKRRADVHPKNEQPYMQYMIAPIISKDMLEMQKLLVTLNEPGKITVDEVASKLLPRARCEKKANVA